MIHNKFSLSMRKTGIYLKSAIIAMATFAYSTVHAQSTFSEVYNILQTSCTFSSCHDNVSPTGGMSLVGLGVDSLNDVYNTLVEATPTNSYAAGKGYVRINPGEPHTSFLFRKINGGLDPHMTLHASEVGSMPETGMLTDAKKELIRQWILFGAPETGTVVDYTLIQDYYANGGIESMPVPPPAPDSALGFQIHLGPFFVPPSTEMEYYIKYDPGFKDTLESNRIDMLMGSSSHHFILARFNLGEETGFQEGFRDDAAHVSTEGVTSTQVSGPMFLPQNTAFLLPQNSWLDLNSHYINFSSTQILKAEVYINIYTQPYPTAKQIMYTSGGLGGLISLAVPNDGTTFTLEDEYYDDGSILGLKNDVYVWSMTSHTHQWGTDFDIYKRDSFGARGTKLFDASNIDGDPNGTDIGYNYAQPPNRYFDPFLFTKKDEGFIFEASWVNTGPNNPVTWGLTSEDEMFIMGIFYVLDTVGLSAVSVPETKLNTNEISVYPNPADATVYFAFDKPVSGTIAIYSAMGMLIDEYSLHNSYAKIDVSTLNSGIYFYRISSKDGIKSGPFTIAH